MWHKQSNNCDISEQGQWHKKSNDEISKTTMVEVGKWWMIGDGKVAKDE